MLGFEMTIIRTGNLSKYFGGVKALDSVTVVIPDGAVGLLGPNGAGKTTLIRVLLGLSKASLGTTSIMGQALSDKNYEIRKRIGYMPEHECLTPTMNAVAFVSYMAMLNGLPSSDAMKRTHEVLNYVGIDDERYRLIKSYSTGMRQKIKFAQSIVHDPELLILDEPTNGMDPKGRRDILNLIKDINRNQKKSLILSSHILDDVQEVCEHVVVLNQGRLVLQNNISELTGGSKDSMDIKIKGDEQLFLSKMGDAGFEVTREGRLFRIKHEKKGLGPILRICAENEIQLRYANQSLNSLEDIFIGALSGGISGQINKSAISKTMSGGDDNAR